MTRAISVSDLIKTFGTVRALDGFNLHVETGQVHGFLGPNGAGKTTSTVILFLTGLGAGIMLAINMSNSGDVWPVAGASITYAPALWLAAGIAVAVFGLYPRAMVLAWFVPVYGFFALMSGPLLGLPQWVYDLSPFEFIPRLPAVELDLVPLLVMTVIAGLLMAAGLFRIRRRDLDLT